MTDQFKQAWARAIDILSRREHTNLELRQKLLNKGFPSEVIERVLVQLCNDNLLNEERFIESFLHSRMSKGYGPLRIQQELRQRGIIKEMIQEVLDIEDDKWYESAIQVRQKRFGTLLPQTQQEWQKQSRFLLYRGFTNIQVKVALSKQ